MSVYITNSSHPKVIGLAQAIEDSGVEAYFWDNGNPSIFDLISKKNPSAVFLNNKSIIDESHVYAKEEYPDIKFILLDEYGETNDLGFDLVINLVKEKEGQWFLDSLANSVQYEGGNYVEEFESDFVVFTDDLDERFVLWIEGLGSTCRLKAYGKKKIPSVYYLGRPAPDEYKDILASTNVVVAFEDNWKMNSIVSDVLPFCYSHDKKMPYEFSTFEELKALTDNYNEAQARSWKKKMKKEYGDLTYSSFVEKLKEEIKI